MCVVFNQLAFKRVDTVKLRTDKSFNSAYDNSGNIIPGQTITEDNKQYFIFEAKLCSMGYTVFVFHTINVKLKMNPSMQ